jgi:hypothetical protein
MANIWSIDGRTYKSTTSGIEVYDISTESLLNFLPYATGINSVWADDTYLYGATNVSGVVRYDIATVTGTSAPIPYKALPNLTSNCVNYLHGAQNYLCVATNSGIDRFNLVSDDRDYSFVGEVSKCFQTTAGDYYYTQNEEFKVSGLDDFFFNWQYVREISLSGTTSGTHNKRFSIPVTSPDDIYLGSYNAVDVRLMQSDGVIIPHYVEIWNYLDEPKIWGRLSSGIDRLYLLYGNRGVSSSGTYFDLVEDTPYIDYTVGRGQDLDDVFVNTKLCASYATGSGYDYIAKGGGVIESNYINDIYVSENTSTTGSGNVIFIGTSYGAYVIEENRGNESECNKKTYLVAS